MARRLAGAFVAALLVAACGTSTPSPTTFAATPEPASLTPFPPQPVRDAIVEQFGIGIGIDPLNPHERDQVAASRSDAIQTALASRGVGMPGPNGKGEIAWTSTGFVYLASYTPPIGPGIYGGGHPDRSPIPAYLVQVVAAPIAGYPGFNTALVIVDARSGALVSTMGSCNGPLCDPH